MTITNQARLGSYNVISDDNMLGQVAMFQDQDQTDPNAPVINSGTPVYAILVKNGLGGVVTPSLGYTFKSGKIGKEVGALSGANAICDGVADPFVSGTIPDGAYFWLIIQGPCELKAGAAGITANAEVQTAANGLFVDGTAGTNPIGHVGKANEAATSGNFARVYFRSPFAAVKP
jgi:hypothetical protein